MLKHIFLLFMLFGSLFCAFFGYGMDQQTKQEIEQTNARYLACVGTEDVPQKIQDRTDALCITFQKKGLLNKDTKVLVKYLSNTMVDYLRKSGTITWNNRLNNGQDLMHISCEHDELTDEEIDSAFGHELAHIVLDQNKHLNPHYYMKNLHLFLLAYSSAWPVTSLCTIMALTKLGRKKLPISSFKQIKYEIGGTALAIVGAHEATTYLFSQVKEHHDRPVHSASRMTYRFLHTFQEVECDVIAALSIPNGGRAGKSLYEKFLQHCGDQDGALHNYPWLSTRVWYHDKIEQMQNLFTTKKEGPTLK